MCGDFCRMCRCGCVDWFGYCDVGSFVCFGFDNSMWCCIKCGFMLVLYWFGWWCVDVFCGFFFDYVNDQCGCYCDFDGDFIWYYDLWYNLCRWFFV